MFIFHFFFNVLVVYSYCHTPVLTLGVRIAAEIENERNAKIFFFAFVASVKNGSYELISNVFVCKLVLLLSTCVCYTLC